MRKAGIVVAGLLVVATACGGGGSRLTKAEFTSKANAICKTGNSDQAAAASKAFPSDAQPTPQQIGDFIRTSLVPNVSSQLDAIDKLKPPKDIQADVDKLLSDARAKLKEIDAEAKSDPAKLASAGDPFTDVNKEANALGLTECGSSG